MKIKLTPPSGMPPEALCLRCGEKKSFPGQPCPKCGFAPEPGTDDELRSVYLSTGRPGADPAGLRADLDQAAAALRSGADIDYDPEILGLLRDQRDRNRFNPNASLGGLVLRFILPALLILAALLLLGAFLR